MTKITITEQDIQVTLHDFEVFCHYLDEHRPKLTQARQELGKKDCDDHIITLAAKMGVKRPRATTKKEPSEQAFAGFFPEGAFDVDVNAIDSVVVQEKDAFAFALADDHLYAFFMDGKPWSQNVY